MSGIDEALDEAITELNSITVDAEIQVRNLAKREVDVRLAPFDVAIDTMTGPEVIERGAFRGIAPDSVLLMGLEHEVHLGIGQDGKVIPVRRPMGRSYAIEERDDGGYGSFRVAKTSAGDEFLALADEGVIRGVSVEMGRNVKTRSEMRSGRRTSVVTFTDTRAISPTYHPAYASAQVLAMRAEQEDAPVATENEAATAAPDETPAAPPAPIQVVHAARSDEDRSLIARMAREVRPVVRHRPRPRREDGGAQPDGLPASRRSTGRARRDARRVDGRGDQADDRRDGSRRAEEPRRRPDHGRERGRRARCVRRPHPRRHRRASAVHVDDDDHLSPPQAGMQLVVPKIVTRPTVGVQSAEKGNLASTDTSITTESFTVATYGGGGDISIQLLKRSDPSFLELYLRLLAEALSIELEEAAVAALIAAVADGGPEPATALNPNSLSLGAAFQTRFSAIRRGPDTIWLSSEAIGEFIDAKATTTNVPLYAQITANFDVPGGISGTIQGLRAVHVPALDAKGAYAIVGPSEGFAHAEDGSYTLQVDVPSKAGRDVFLVTMAWMIPWYPEAFTLYNVAS